MEIIYKNLTAILILLVNLLISISYFIIYSNDNLKKVFFKLPMLLQKIYVAFFVLPIFSAPFFSYSKFANSNLIFIISGILLSISGFLIIIFSFLKIGIVPSIKSNSKLSTSGIYKLVRHPIYFGTIVTQLGLILLNQALISLIYLPLSIILYYIMATIEEKDLINIFGKQYLEFRSKTRGKVIPFIF